MDQNKAAGLIRFDVIEIDLDGHRLRVDGAVVPLEPKAFAVLSLLAQHPGQVLTRDQILDAVWGHTHVTPSVLNRIITLLRHALGESGGTHRYLHTVHGVGYRFDLPAAPAVTSATMDAAASLQPTESQEDPAPLPMLASTQPDAMPALGVDRPSQSQRQPQRTLLHRWGLPLLALLVVAGAWQTWQAVARHRLAIPATASAPTATPSVAVLPLANASGDADQQFFADGLSDNLIDALSRFEGLKVIGRISSFRFRGSTEGGKSIGAQLGAAYLVSGNVQHAGDSVRIGIELSSAVDGRTLWVEHYDRPYRDLFALQDEIAQAVANALHARLMAPGAGASHTDRPPGGNIEAYVAYLQASKYWHAQQFEDAASHLQRAVQIDPDYAIAWAHLAASLGTVARFWSRSAEQAHDSMRRAHLAADKALQLAPNLAQAHAARAYLHFYEFDQRGALAECRRAVQLAPGDDTNLNGCAYTFAGIGKLAEAIQLRRQLLAIEPLYYVNDLELTTLLVATGRLDEAERYLRLATSLMPESSPPPKALIRLAIARGDMQAAQEAARARSSSDRELYLALVAQMSTDRAQVDAALAQVLANPAWMDAQPYLVAQIYALRGDHAKVIEWLERTPAGDLLFLPADPLILRLRGDSRLEEFCRKTGLPSPRDSDALSLDEIRALPTARRDGPHGAAAVD